MWRCTIRMGMVRICDKVGTFSQPDAPPRCSQPTTSTDCLAMSQHPLSPLPLGAVLLAGSLNAFAQTSPTLPTVEVRDQAIAALIRDLDPDRRAADRLLGRQRDADHLARSAIFHSVFNQVGHHLHHLVAIGPQQQLCLCPF